MKNGSSSCFKRTRNGTAGWLSALLLLTTTAMLKANDFTYTTNSPDTNTITITGYTGSGGAVVIPPTIDGETVTSVAGFAFAGYQSLTSVTIPDGVTSIGNYAFYVCYHLTNVTIGNSVTNIGQLAFYSCISLASITIPNSVISIGNQAFYSCVSLTGVYFTGNAPDIGSSVFDGDNSATVYYFPETTVWSTTFGGLTTVLLPYFYSTDNGAITITLYTGSGGAVIIPNTINGAPVTSIGNSAFQYCTSLSTVTIPNSITNIGDYAFQYCGMTNATIPDSVISIGDYAFQYCGNLSSVVIGNGVTSIGDGAFYYCASLSSIAIPASVTSIGNSTFSYCTSLTVITVDALNSVYSSVDGVLFNKSQTNLIECPGGEAGSYTIPDSVTGVGDYAFQYCTSLTSVTIPDSVTSIGDSTFQYCYGLTNVTIPNGITNIGNSAFYYCTSLISVTIPSSVTNIGDSTFYECTSLTSVTIPNGITNIGDSAFYYCTSLTSVTIPGSVTNIGNSAFYACGSLSSITIPDTVTGIGDYAFYYCTSLTNVMIGNNVTNIGNSAFYYCTSLTSAMIPNSVASIGDGAFYSCASLTNVMIGNSVASIGDGAFQYCDSLTSITIPDSVTSIQGSAFQHCTNLTSVTIGKGVTSIGDWAFYYCVSLTGVYFTGNAPDIGSSVFDGDNNATVYYLQWTTGWGATFGGCPTALWNPQGTGESIDAGAWPYRMQLTFPGYNGTEVLTNFPALVILSTNLPGFSYSQFASTNGYDLRFSASESDHLTELNYEIEQWATNGNSCVWVQVPQFYSGCYIWAYWGNPNAATVPAVYTTNGATWPTNAFAGVWHMGQTNTLDSTANGNNGTAVTATGSISNANGNIGGAQHVSGGGHVTITNSGSLSFTTNLATYSAWVNFNALPGANEQVIMRKEQNREMGFSDSGHVRSMLKTDGTTGWTAANDDAITPVAGQWYYLAFTYDGSKLRNFWNGVPLNAGHVVTGNIVGDPYTTGIGAYNGSGDAGPVSLGLDAIIDEVRAEQVFRSTNWMWATYLTVASNASFSVYGSVQTGGGSTNTSAAGVPPAVWIQQYFPGTPTNNYASLAGSCVNSNGMTVWQDYVAGVNPTNPGSSFSVIITNMAGQIVVTVLSMQTNADYTGVSRYYEIDECTNLSVGGSWQPAPGYTGIQASGGIIACTNAAQNPAIFYRAKVLLQ